jgi:hypothetical protein
MVFVNKSYDPKEIEELGFVLEDDIVKEKIGEETVVVPETDIRLTKAVKTKLNWSLLGPVVAVILFVFSWGGIISERAYTASVNVESIEKLDKKFIKQNDKITSVMKANERQEIMIEKQMQVLKRQDSVLTVRENYMNKRLDAVGRGVVDEIRSLRLTIEALRIEIRALKRK